MRRPATVLAVLALALAACGDAGDVDGGIGTPAPEADADFPADSPAARPDTGPAEPLPPETGPDGVPPEDWTIGIVDRPKPEVGVATLSAVRAARHEGYDRIVFEFADAVPGYHLEYIDRPVRQCGSGNVVRIAGDGWLEMRMRPAMAHTEEGRPTVTERERMPNLPVVRELELTCDFEADVTWVAGTAAPNAYRVFELDGPPRLVVDVRHR